MLPHTVTRWVEGEAQTQKYASLMAKSLSAPAVLYFSGPIGVGKTTFIRALMRALGCQGPVKSPTFALVEPYDFWQAPIYHLDLYRLTDPNELEYIGIRECFSEKAVCIIEWPEHAQDRLPEPDLAIQLSHLEQMDSKRNTVCDAPADSASTPQKTMAKRRIDWHVYSKKGQALLEGVLP